MITTAKRNLKLKKDISPQKSHEDSQTTTDSDSDSSNKEIQHEPITFLERVSCKDKAISSLIHHMQANSFIEFLIYLCGRLFNPDVITCYFIILLSYNAYYYNDYYYIIKPLIHVLVVVLVTVIMKHCVGRTRPHLSDSVTRRYNLRSRERNCSMPSGDSMQCASFAIIFLCYMNCPYGFILIPLVMFSRIYFFCHFLMDTVVGTVLGFIISYLLVLALRLI